MAVLDRSIGSQHSPLDMNYKYNTILFLIKETPANILHMMKYLRIQFGHHLMKLNVSIYLNRNSVYT